MTDMRTAGLMHGANGAHSVFTLSVSRYALSPSSSGAETRLSLLEGDCVGLHGHYLKPGSQGPGFFSSVIPGRALRADPESSTTHCFWIPGSREERAQE